MACKYMVYSNSIVKHNNHADLRQGMPEVTPEEIGVAVALFAQKLAESAIQNQMDDVGTSGFCTGVGDANILSLILLYQHFGYDINSSSITG